MKKLVISTLLACACFGAGLSSEVKGYLDYIAQNACNDEKLKELYESCLPSGPIFCARMRDAECPFELQMQDDKTVQKLAAVIKKNQQTAQRPLARFLNTQNKKALVLM